MTVTKSEYPHYEVTVEWVDEKKSKAAGEDNNLSSNPNSNPRNPLLSPTQIIRVKRSRLDILILLALGVTAHDIASIYGFHIPGLHAIYFSLPMIGILMSVKLERWLRSKRRKTE